MCVYGRLEVAGPLRAMGSGRLLWLRYVIKERCRLAVLALVASLSCSAADDESMEPGRVDVVIT